MKTIERLSRREREVLERFKILLGQRLRLHSLVLFGSRARGDADEDSDMDVLVILDDINAESGDIVSRCAWEAGFDVGIVVVPVTFGRSEWENGPERVSLLAAAVRMEGMAV